MVTVTKKNVWDKAEAANPFDLAVSEEVAPEAVPSPQAEAIRQFNPRMFESIINGEIGTPLDVRTGINTMAENEWEDENKRRKLALTYSMVMGETPYYIYENIESFNRAMTNGTMDQVVKSGKMWDDVVQSYTDAKSWSKVVDDAFMDAGVSMVKGIAGMAKIEAELGGRFRKWAWGDLQPEYQKKLETAIEGWSDLLLKGVQDYYRMNKKDMLQLMPGTGYRDALLQYVFRPKLLVQGLIQSTPMILEGVLGGMVAGPAGAISLMGFPITGDVYVDAREEGTAPLPAFAQSFLTGMGEATIEHWTLSKKLGIAKNIRKIVSDGLPKILWEGAKTFFRGTAEEGSQEFNRNFWQWVFTDRSQEWSDNVKESMAAGGPMELVMAGLFAGVGAVGNVVTKPHQEQRIEKISQAVEDSPLDKKAKKEINNEIEKVKKDVEADVYVHVEEEAVEKPEAKPVQKDLLGRPILQGGAAGKQTEFLSKEDYKLREPDIEGQMIIPSAPAKSVAKVETPVDWDRRSKNLANKAAKEIRNNEIYKLYDKGVREGMDVYQGKVYVTPNFKGEAQDAIANHPNLKFRITYDPAKGKHYDEIITESGEDIDISVLLDRMGEAMEAKKKKSGLNQKALDEMEASGDPHAVILAAKWEMLNDGFLTPEEINDNINRIAKEWPDMTQEDIRAYYVEQKDVEAKPTMAKKVPGEAEATPKAKRVISKEAYEKAKKRLTDRDVMRTGLDPQGFADMATIGAYHIESGLRTFGAWSKKMIDEFGEKIKPHLNRIWKDAKKSVQFGPLEDRKSLIKQIHTIKTHKGLTDKQYKELRAKSTESGLAKSSKNMTIDELETLLVKMKRARPRTIGGKRVITSKTERAIQSLKSSLKAKLAMTDDAFAEILQKEIHGREPKFTDARHFITETQGKDIIRRMHDKGEVLRVTNPREQAVAKSEDISKQVKSLRERIAKEPKKDPSRLESMRYYCQTCERVTGEPVYSMYKDIIDVKNEIEKTRHARMAKLEADVPGFREIAGDEEALQRVSDYIASQSTLKDRPEMPKNITKAEIKMAKDIQKICKDYVLKARVSKFFQWYYYGDGIAEYEQYKKEIHKAEDIYDSQGKEALIEYLKTQTWGVIKSGYEPLANVLTKIRVYKPSPKTVGKGHIRIRTDIEYHKQEKNIIQRLNSYMRQMDLLYNMSPKINAFMRMFDDNMSSFEHPRIVADSIASFIRNVKHYNIEGGWWGDMLARIYAQVAQVVIMSQPVLAFRNLFQNVAFEHDKSILFDPRNESLTPEDIEYLETHVQQLRGMMEEYFMVNEKALPGLKNLTKLLRKIRVYGHSDVENRHWGFWAKINQTRRAWEADSLEERMEQAKFEDMTEQEQVMALSILAEEGADAMAWYVSRVHVDDIHFLYERSQRSPSEMDTLGRVMGNLMLFPRAYAEKLVHAGNTLKDKNATYDQKKRAAKRIIAVVAGGYMAGIVYMMITGRKRNPYDPFQILQVSPGGLVFGATKNVFEAGTLTIRALAGDKTAMYALTSALPEMADDFIPFYDWTFRTLEAASDTKNLDKRILREIYELVDKEYEARDGAYKMERSFVKKIQYIFSGPSADVEEEEGDELWRE